MISGRIDLYEEDVILESQSYTNKEDRDLIIDKWKKYSIRGKENFYIHITPKTRTPLTLKEVKQIMDANAVLCEKRVHIKMNKYNVMKRKVVIPEEKPFVRAKGEYSNQTDYSSKYL